MGKVKIKRKSTLIDMTAMSDVTVLLLTFFMLTSTFLQKEPVTVLTPSSVSEEKVPTSNLCQVLVSPEGKVFISIAGEADLTNNPEEWGSEPLRMAALQKAVGRWNQLHPKQQVQLTPSQIEAFSKINMFGVPFTALPTFLSLSTTEQDKIISDMSRADVGIPVNDNKNRETPNEFQIWIESIRDAGNENLYNTMRNGDGIAVKADKDTSYDKVHTVLDNLQTIKMNKFTLMTALKTEND